MFKLFQINFFFSLTIYLKLHLPSCVGTKCTTIHVTFTNFIYHYVNQYLLILPLHVLTSLSFVISVSIYTFPTKIWTFLIYSNILKSGCSNFDEKVGESQYYEKKGIKILTRVRVGFYDNQFFYLYLISESKPNKQI